MRIREKAPKKVMNLLARLWNNTQAFKGELAELYDETESHELPSIDSSYFSYDDIELPEISEIGAIDTDAEYGFKFDFDEDIWRVAIREDEGEFYIEEAEGLNGIPETIKYYKRRIRKAWKIWQSENPEAEEEKDEDEEE